MTQTTTVTALAVALAAIALVARLVGFQAAPPANAKAGGAQQALTPERVVRLGEDLTPIGAERAGNAAGSIPGWTGGLPKSPPVDWSVGYTDPFVGEQPLFTITAANAEKYKDILSPGHLAIFKRDRLSFRMNVYPSHRSAAYPQDVMDEVKQHAGQSIEDGHHIRNVGRTTVPFPIPQDGLQVMWNHVFRWRGGSFERQFVWAPVAPTGGFYIVRVRLNVAFDQQGYVVESRPDRLYNANQFFLSPPSAIGYRQVQWEPIDPLGTYRIRWLHVTQTLDDRRLPSYEYDTIEPYTGGLRDADQNDGWNGAPDRYNWRLVGKQERLIGYNGYKLADRTLKYPEIIRAHHLNPDLLRYERHRVWVVEATLRKGRAERLYRRIFYVDEDTWQVAQEEVYNKKGQMTRFGDHHMIQFYDVLVPWYAVTIHHDMVTGAYLVQYLDNQEAFPPRWGFKARIADYLPSNLRSLGLP